jgi:cell division protein FtsN
MAGAAMQPGRWRMLAGLALLAALMALAVAVWFVARGGVESALTEPEAIPIARAPESPDRERPENPGGETVPDRDKEVYSTFESDRARGEPVVERLLPAAETPMQEPAPKAVAADDGPAVADEPGNAAAETAEPDDAPPAVEEVTVAARPAPTPPPAAVKEPEPDPAPTRAVPAAPAGDWQVQLAALRDEAAAMQTWRRISARQKTLLQGLSPDVSRLETRDRGVFYRLRVGGFATRDGAAELCERLKKAGQDCLVARR